MVAGAQEPPQHLVKAHGVARRQDHVGGIREGEQPAEPLPQAQRHQAGGLGRAVGRAVHRRTHLLQVFHHPPRHSRRLGKDVAALSR